MPKKIYVVMGFVVLFAIYHFPEFYNNFWITAVFKPGFILASYIIARKQGIGGFAAYGLDVKRAWIPQLLMGLLLGAALFALSAFWSYNAGYYSVVRVDTLIDVIVQLPGILLMTAVPSIAEDILTRGYLFAHLKSILKPGVWIAVSAIVYWLNHIWRLNDAAAVMAYLIMLGIVLAYTVHITGALWLAFGIHWGANIVFTITHQCMEFTADNTHKSTWVLAIAWALLLLLLMAWKNFLAVQDGKENS